MRSLCYWGAILRNRVRHWKTVFIYWRIRRSIKIVLNYDFIRMVSMSSLLSISHHIPGLENRFLNCIDSLNKLNWVSRNSLFGNMLRILLFRHSLKIVALVFWRTLPVNIVLHEHVSLRRGFEIVLNRSLNVLHSQSALWGNRIKSMLFLAICTLIGTKVVFLTISYHWCFYWSGYYLNMWLIGDLLEFQVSLISCLM